MRLFMFFIFCSLFMSALPKSEARQSLEQGYNDGAYLDPQYPKRIRPATFDLRINRLEQLPSRSDTEALIDLQSEIKSQGSRGTCSIFSATALLESLLITNFNLPKSTDLSEEWLEYITHTNTTEDGSSSYGNFTSLARHGSASEELWNYEGVTWTTLDSSELARIRCSGMSPKLRKTCFVAHRDPLLLGLSDAQLKEKDAEFFKIRKNAHQLRDKYLGSIQKMAVISVYRPFDIKMNLINKIPMTLDLDFYYGAWNHRVAEEHEIPRNMENWDQGIVGYPEEDSKDRELALIKPAGHSIVVVGYDDDVEIKLETVMKDGSTKTTVHKGVYYFKNSWGSDNFGVDFKINGHSYPGYGMITQDYAHEFGVFYQMPLKEN